MSGLVTLKSRLGLEAMMFCLGLEAMMSRLVLGRIGPRSSSDYNHAYSCFFFFHSFSPITACHNVICVVASSLF